MRSERPGDGILRRIEAALTARCEWCGERYDEAWEMTVERSGRTEVISRLCRVCAQAAEADGKGVARRRLPLFPHF